MDLLPLKKTFINLNSSKHLINGSFTRKNISLKQVQYFDRTRMNQNKPQEAFSTENIFLKLYRIKINSSQVTSSFHGQCNQNWKVELYVLK